MLRDFAKVTRQVLYFRSPTPSPGYHNASSDKKAPICPPSKRTRSSPGSGWGGSTDSDFNFLFKILNSAGCVGRGGAFLSRSRRGDSARGQQVPGAPRLAEISLPSIRGTSRPRSLGKERRRGGRGRPDQLAAAIRAFLATLRFCPFCSRWRPFSEPPRDSLYMLLITIAIGLLLTLNKDKLSFSDLSRNRFTEIPSDVWLFAPLETLNLYHNCIKAIPETIKNLQMLTYLNISRNLLSTLPKYLFDLPLKVLVVSNNKLVSIPEEIGKLKDLMELDISCNEIQVLPQQIGKLHSLRELNIRRNNLHMLPDELGDLPLVKLDFSCNKVTEIPVCYRKLRHLQVIILDNNPMQIPPAQICLKGKVHIFKFLNIRACCRIGKKPDSLDLPSLGKRIPSQPLTDSMEDFYPNKNHGPDSGIGSDNGEKRLSTTEPSDDDTISLHSQVSESTRDQTLRNDNHLMGSKLDSHKDQEVYDYIDPNPEDVAVPEQGDAHIGSFVSFLKGREKYSEKSQKNEEWGDEKRIQKEQLLAEEEDDDLKEVTDLRKIAAQLLQQEQKNRLLNHSSSVNPRNRPKQTVEFEKSVLADEVNSALSPFMWQPLGNQKDPLDEQQWPETQPIIWQNEERRRSKQIRKEYFKYKSSRKNSSGNEHEEQDSDNANVSPQSPVSSEDFDRTDSYSHGPFGLKPRSAFSRSSRQEYGTADPGFTMRRKMEHLREEREQIRQLRNNLESRLKVILPDDIGAALMDGVVLCHLANHIRPRSVASIHVPSPAVPKLSMAKCRRNVENFLDACKKLGVSQERLCLPHHILEERGLVKVGVTVQALLELPTTKASQLSAA
ncbi:LOW QUALITY PROTEIN: leucine-rich repeat and calponin homology domain-containing protein 2 [Vombatus ursinus]|uniref:LOW QUALITY PROTEIN: leucine-rich repeat and calponin homology domain-containing protein 2 n=1 Tax=Vombatus ursinus TaxID=29139 RepID=UPI000FFD11A0|nr:LOW QUALITY PROTEIN: leucine-rich repeat and calponin homology domain-containing protein 2 [Vombatus ursinus]